MAKPIFIIKEDNLLTCRNRATLFFLEKKNTKRAYFWPNGSYYCMELHSNTKFYLGDEMIE